MYLSYSGHKAYRECPKQYWHRYVDKTTVPPDNCVNSLYGSTVGVVFEQFYAEKLWKRPDCEAELKVRAPAVLAKVIKEQRNAIVDWGDEKANYHDQESLLQDVAEAIPRGLRTIRSHRLVGVGAGAEVVLDQTYGPHKIGGRADFIIPRVAPHRDLVIIDGKGTKWGRKYVEDQQLLWYGFLHRDKFGRAPDRIGFLFWRFDPAKAVSWTDFSGRDLDALKAEVLATMDRLDRAIAELRRLSDSPKAHDELRQEKFPAQPAFKCGMCSYLKVCEEGQAKQGRKGGDFPRRSLVTIPGTGVREFGFDGD